MELATIFLIWLVVTIIDNLSKRKKNRIPPPQNKNDAPDFEIPTIAGDPNLPGEEVPIFVEVPQPAEIRPKNPAPRPKKIVEPVREVKEPSVLNLNLTPSTVIDAFVLTEILGKPKSMKRRR